MEKKAEKKDALLRRGSEEVLLRGYYLRLLARWYLVPLAMLCGALAGAAVYYCAHVAFAPAREYAAGARLYLTFAEDAAGNVYDYYNAWTWKELITGDDILNAAMETLIREGWADEAEKTGAALASDKTTVKKEDDELQLVPGGRSEDGKLTRAEVLEAVTVRLPSDLRVMMLTVTRGDAASSDAVLAAMTGALVSFGETDRNFTEIRLLEQTPALLVVTTDRTKTAVLWGAVLGGLCCLFGMFLYHALDDALYDPEMCGRRFALPVLGVLGSSPSDQMARELRAACETRLAGAHRVAVSAASGKENDGARISEALAKMSGGESPDAARVFVPMEGAEEVDAAIVAVPYGKRTGAYADHLLAALSAREIPVAGVILYDANMRYLRRLYGLS